jgi:hypothetical protein
MGVLVPRLAWLGAALTVALSLLTGGAVAPPAARAWAPTPSTTTLGPPDLDPKPVGHTATLTATVTPGATGAVIFYDEDLAVATVQLTGSTAAYLLPAYAPPGLHTITAAYLGDANFGASRSEPRPVTVGPRQVTLTVGISGPHDATGATAQQGDILRVEVGVRDLGTTGSLPVSGTISVWVDGSIECGAAIPAGACDLPTAAWPLGTRSVLATYDPMPVMYAGAEHAPGSSGAVAVRLVANPVEAVGLPPTNLAFYPYPDGYRDTTTLLGRRDEAASVNVSITSPTGGVVKREDVPLGIGAWSVTWDGRNGTGKVLAAGRYTVRQTVTDTLGATKTFTSRVNLSHERLQTRTVTLVKSYAQATENRSGAGWLGWTFTLPSATVYRKLVFSVSGKSGTPRGIFGPHDYATCPSTAAWDWDSCMSPFAEFPASASWRSVDGSVAQNRHGTTVRMYAVGGNRTEVRDARVTVTYAVLR